MIHDSVGAIDYDEYGHGPGIVFVPGSCSTGAAWRPVIAALGNGHRCITTSLPGYGRTAERRGDDDHSIDRVAEVVEQVVMQAGAPVHLVGHSFGGLVAIAVAHRRKVRLASLSIFEAPAVMMLRHSPADTLHDQAFRSMNDAYFAAFANGEREAISRMIDFYGGAGTFASWPERVRAYAIDTTAVNIRDWKSAFGLPLSAEKLAAITLPTLVAWGGNSHPAVKRANVLLADAIPASQSAVLAGAAHFMIATHAAEVATLVSQQIQGLASTAEHASGLQ